MTTQHLLKEKQVNELAEKIKNSKTLMIVSIKGLPSKQFQEIKKSIRDEAAIKVAKKNILLRAIKSLKKESILELEKHIEDNSAFAFSNTEGYELASLLLKNKTPVFAKAGQEAPDDIEVKEGPTDLMPGPAISELGSLGLQVAVEDGKISIKKTKTVLNKGQIINENAASILQKLHIQPFNIGLIPVAIYDTESEKVYTEIKIDSEETTANLKDAAAKALGFAQKITYFCKETIAYFLAKASLQEKSLSNLQPKEETKEEPQKEKEETKEEPEGVVETIQEKAKEIIENVKENVKEVVETIKHPEEETKNEWL